MYQMTPEVAFTPSVILREKKKYVRVRKMRAGMCDHMTYIKYMYGSYGESVVEGQGERERFSTHMCRISG